MSDTWEHDPHEVAHKLDETADGLAAAGSYDLPPTLQNAAQMIRDLWEQDAERMQLRAENNLMREALEESLDALISSAAPDDSADREALIQARQSARKAIAKSYGESE